MDTLTRLLNYAVVMIPILFMISCSENDPNIDDIKMLKKMQVKWLENKPDNYQYDLKILCYCNPIYTGPFEVIMKDGQLDTILYSDITEIEYFYGVELTDSLIQLLFNDIYTQGLSEFLIDSIYLNLFHDLKSKPYNFQITYDTMYAFPEEFYIDFKKEIADEEFGTRISNFGIIE